MITRSFGLKLGRFGLVGGLSTVIYVVLSISGNAWTALPAELVNTIAYCCSGAWGYVGHYHITFRSDAAHKASIARFVVLFLSGFVVSSGIVFVNQALGLPRQLGPLVATIVLPVMNFIIMQLWVFAGRPAGPFYGVERERDPRA